MVLLSSSFTCARSVGSAFWELALSSAMIKEVEAGYSCGLCCLGPGLKSIEE